MQVVDAGSFAKAASANYVSTQSVAQQIAKLEDEVGTALLERSSHGVTPTEAGRAFFEGVSSIDRQLATLVATCRTIGNPDRDLIRIGSDEGYSLELFARFVPDFLRRHPGIDIEYCAVGTDPMQDLRDGVYDVVEGTDVQVSDPSIADMIDFEPLIFTRRCVTVSTKNPLARKDVVEPADLDGMSVYVFSLAWAQRLSDYLAQRGLSVEFHEFSELPTRDHRSLLHAPAGDMSVALLPEHMAHLYAPLVCVPFDADVSIRYGLLFRDDQRRRLTPFLEEARRMFGV